MFFCFRILRMICKVFWGTNGYMRKTGGTTISMSQQILGIYSSLKCRKGVNCCCIIDSNENGIDYVPTSQINLYSYSGWLYNQNLISSLMSGWIVHLHFPCLNWLHIFVIIMSFIPYKDVKKYSVLWFKRRDHKNACNWATNSQMTWLLVTLYRITGL
jgi:hypothetical protein